jgi:hypothetical protein
MRTAIYVYSSSPGAQVEFSVSSDAVVSKYETPTSESKVVVNDNGKCTLTTGIYKVVSSTPVGIQSLPGNLVDYDVVAVTSDKDPWPEPPARFQALFSDVSTVILRAFLPAGSGAFGASANDQPPR